MGLSMRYTVAIQVDHLEFFDVAAGALSVSGAHLTIAALLHYIAADPTIEALEVFIPDALMVRTDALRRAATSLLPPERCGQGFLRFYPIHSLPEIWADAKPRILLAVDPELYVRARYLRDRFARGPMPLVCDTHTLGHYGLWRSLVPLNRVPPVSYDAMTCLSVSTKDALERGFSGYLAPPGTPLPCRFDILPHAVDTELFHPRTETEKIEARRLLGLPLEGQITLCLGRMTAYSKADLLPLLDAFVAASDRPDDYLLLAGIEYPSGYREELRTAGAACGLADRLLLHREVPPVLRSVYYAAADLFVLPADSIIECLGNVLMEAMASGLPVISSDWNGCRDVVQDGITGRLIPTYWMPGLDRIEAMSPASAQMQDYLLLAQSVWVDEPALRRALRELLDDGDKRQQWGRAGRTYAAEHLSIPAIMQRWHDLWDTLLELAEQETAEEVRARREAAQQLAYPVPYLQIFDHYATEVINPSTHAVRLSPKGANIVASGETVSFYDDTLPLLHQNVLDALLNALGNAGTRPLPLAQLAAQTATHTGQSENSIRFHVGLFLKRGLLELCDARTQPFFSAGKRALEN
jgi:glycosyltransferase involved in cell wall biosynthesis